MCDDYKNQRGPEQANLSPSVCSLLLRLQFNLFFSDPCDRWASFPPSLSPSLQEKQLCPVKGGVFEVCWKLCQRTGGIVASPPWQRQSISAQTVARRLLLLLLRLLWCLPAGPCSSVSIGWAVDYLLLRGYREPNLILALALTLVGKHTPPPPPPPTPTFDFHLLYNLLWPKPWEAVTLGPAFWGSMSCTGGV